MSSEIWVVTGLDDDARRLAHDASGRAGLSTGAWIERAIGKSANVRPTAPVDPPPEEEEDDPGETEMIAVLRAIGQRIDETGERLTARTASRGPTGHSPVEDTDPLTTNTDETEPSVHPAPRPGWIPRSVSWRGAALGACIMVAVGAGALSQIPGVGAIWQNMTENGSAAGTAGQPHAVVGVEPNIVSRDLRIAAALAAPTPVDVTGRDSTLLSALRHAAATGDARAQHSLGLLYATGHSASADRRRAPIWLHRAAAQGLPEAAYHLGVIYERGDGVVKDRPKAIRFYRRAAEMNHPRAQHNLAVALATGPSSDVDFARVASWIGAAANAGIPESQFALGLLYERGLGVARDPTVAEAWHRQAANGGHAGARTWLRRAASEEPIPDARFGDLLRPLGFDPKAVARVARIAGEIDPTTDSRHQPVAGRRADAAEETYFLLLGSSLGEIEFPAPSAAPNGPDPHPDVR